MPDIARLIADVEQRLGGSGRLLVRYSGTEMLARVMVEGADGARSVRWRARSATPSSSRRRCCDRIFFAALDLQRVRPDRLQIRLTVRFNPR